MFRALVCFLFFFCTCIGLSLAELERLGTTVSKTASHDIPYVLARGGNGATTVSATMFFASKVVSTLEKRGAFGEFKVFVTGGMGGVHRQGVKIFTPNSGCKAPCRADSVEECADIIEANTKFGLGSGILIGVPIPAEHAAATKNVNRPYNRHCMKQNIQLVKNNALVGAKIATALTTAFLNRFDTRPRLIILPAARL
ncbi:hypothetical protein SELMODRAFT_413373 [Selaginella moellendorffii]|uniref:Uncharacterized protein n=1 Tax=Selaginella moellendorffii TaxID=88036 RepID=D8RP89_SELML|nr:hypothetical protein SELMODRAFT_413373 [Selaginella moellendorffii]